MLTVAEDTLLEFAKARGKAVVTHMCGQEINAETYAIAKADFLLKGDLNRAIAQARKEIELMREYRTRLTADVVTGQLDVREAAAKLPDTLVEQEALDPDIDDEGDDFDEDESMES